MLEIVLVVVLLLWLFGAFGAPMVWTGYHSHSAIHLLLVIALVVVVVRLTRGR
jgi:hypothetical protein